MSSLLLDPAELEELDPRTWQEWFDTLSDEEKQAAAERAQNWPRVAPSKGPQTAAFNSPADVLGYGGAAGGGKSALAGILALLNHNRTLILRNDATQLHSLIDDIVGFYGSSEGLNRQAHIFRLADRPGHLIEWGGIGKPRSELVWQGRPHDLIVVDEATQCSYPKIKFLGTWLRTTDPNQRCREVYTFNPPGGPDDVDGDDNGQWVIDVFAPWISERHPNPAAYGELRYFAVNPESGEDEEVKSGEPFEFELRGQNFVIHPRSRTFIPARVTDNPFFSDGAYLQRLLALEEPLRSRMLFGDFRTGLVDADYQVIPTAWVDAAMDRWTPEGIREPMTAMGVDVARGGKDFTVLARRHGWWWNKLLRRPGGDCRDGPTVRAFCMEEVRNGAEIDIDTIGVGSSPYDFLVEAGANVVGVVGSARQNIPKIHAMMGFANMRSFLYWMLRKIMDPANGLLPALPKDNRLRAELIAHRYDQTSGLIRVEPKEKLKERLGYSPDDADSVAYSVVSALDTPGGERLASDGMSQVDKDEVYRELYGPSRGRDVVLGSKNASWMSM